MDQQTLITVLILVAAAFIPSIVYLVWIRNIEEYLKASWGKLSIVFIWGAVFAVIIAVILSLLFVNVLSAESLQREYEPLKDPTVMTLVIVCVVAPIVEEFTKAVGVFTVRGSVIELEDGLVFGAASGLGFAATENLLYESSAFFQHGVEAFIMTVMIRSIASTLLHGSASAVAGYGISKSILGNRYSAVPFYFVAVIMHGSFNYLASVNLLYGGNIPLLALIAAVLFSLTAFTLVKSKIKDLDSDFTYHR